MNTCPKCGAKFDDSSGAFECGSYERAFTGILNQSGRCELTKLKADVERLRTSIRHLLLSADAVWYEKNEGHDWRVAVDEAARALEETK